MVGAAFAGGRRDKLPNLVPGRTYWNGFVLVDARRVDGLSQLRRSPLLSFGISKKSSQRSDESLNRIAFPLGFLQLTHERSLNAIDCDAGEVLRRNIEAMKESSDISASGVDGTFAQFAFLPEEGFVLVKPIVIRCRRYVWRLKSSEEFQEAD